jgi:hypothetical protein
VFYSYDNVASGGTVSYDYWVIKIDNSGNIEWEKKYGGSDDEQVGNIIQTIDGGYIVTGSSRSNDRDISINHGSYDFWVVKLDSSGIIQWEKSYGGSYGDARCYIQQYTCDEYIIAGYATSSDGGC